MLDASERVQSRKPPCPSGGHTGVTLRAAALSERDTLRAAYTAVKLELELMKKRLFVAKAERVDIAQRGRCGRSPLRVPL